MWGFLGYLLDFLHFEEYPIHFCGTNFYLTQIQSSLPWLLKAISTVNLKIRWQAFHTKGNTFMFIHNFYFFSVSFGLFIVCVLSHLAFGRLGCVIYDVTNMFWPHSSWWRSSYFKQRTWLSTRKIIFSKKLK